MLLSILLVQQQSNVVDCGLFTIVYARCLAYGEDPWHVIYDTSSICTHLDHRLENGKLTPFPKKAINRART